MSATRLVAVLGYSDGSGDLHPVCSARLARAAEIAGPTDTVLLSGWARKRDQASEAELMAHAWPGATDGLLLDRDARSTYGNVVGAGATARSLGARELVLVTSGWHARRAAALMRAAVRGTQVRVEVAPTRELGSRRARVRELACWTLVPAQALLARRRR
ncbi:MAG: YdcF family protein [Gaiellaceae bacterium]